MPGNRTFLLMAIAYVLLIYGTSGWMRSLSTFARQLAGDSLGPLMTAALGLVLAAVLTAIFRIVRPHRLLPYLPIVLGYGLALFWLAIPEERFHLLQYGILCFLCDRALPASLRGWRRHLLVIALVCLAGIGDELIQWLRPNRVGDLRDVIINTVAAILAQALIATSAGSSTHRQSKAGKE
jgi:hypothetical protein